MCVCGQKSHEAWYGTNNIELGDTSLVNMQVVAQWYATPAHTPLRPSKHATQILLMVLLVNIYHYNIINTWGDQ